MMHLLRCLFFFEAAGEFYLAAAYIPGPQNDLADDISRGRTLSFLSKVPAACPHPAPVHPAILSMLLHSKPDWSSRDWRNLFGTILQEA